MRSVYPGATEGPPSVSRSLVHIKMSDSQILYEAKLPWHGRRLAWASLLGFVLYVGVVSAVLFVVDSFPDNVGPLIGINVVGAVIFGVSAVVAFRWRRNPGIYRISIDNHGLYVHSDDRWAGQSFSVIAPDIRSLVRKTCRHADSTDTYEYYVQTKSGRRHRIGDLFADLEPLDLFEKIIGYFHWVEVVEE